MRLCRRIYFAGRFLLPTVHFLSLKVMEVVDFSGLPLTVPVGPSEKYSHMQNALRLDLFRKVPNLRILACGGDGTVGWIFSELDKMGIEPPPPVGVLPLGTGNDLARALGWGGGYTDEPISKILCHIEEGDIVQLDRWTLRVEPNSEVSVETQKGGGDATFGEGEVKDSPPLNVVNNYFSIGVDAHIALEFHEARGEAS
ncbi:unnamed protein product, partial [Notodromas monacha]